MMMMLEMLNLLWLILMLIINQVFALVQVLT
jgi:hypothetical protein